MSWQSDPAPDLPEGSEEPLWTIAEVREHAGISARTLRYYEEMGLLPGVRRRAGGRRVYGPDELERLRFIQRLKALGLSLAEIKDLNAVYAIGGSTKAMLGRLDQLLAERREEVDSRIRELSALREEIDLYRDRIQHRSHGSPNRGKANGKRNGS